MGQNRGRSHRIFTPNKLDLTLWAPTHCAKFYQNRIKIAALGVFTATPAPDKNSWGALKEGGG